MAEHKDQVPNHLIIVCGHAIWAGGPTTGENESEWIIEDWKKGETPTYTEHIKAGLMALNADDRALLVFSGGPTVSSTSESEAHSYERLAHANNYWGLVPFEPKTTDTVNQSMHHPIDSLTPFMPAHARILLDTRALDSYQNILFSLLEFWRATDHNHWPDRLTIVSHAFKRRRLVEAHCIAALGFSLDRVAFIGINPPGVPEVLGGEERAVEAWLQDPHGQSEPLREKRRGRNPHGVAQTLFLAERERELGGIATVLSADGKEEFLVPDGFRPWVRHEGDGKIQRG
ncbi:unnamed protein product [Discula destructiva]